MKRLMLEAAAVLAAFGIGLAVQQPPVVVKLPQHGPWPENVIAATEFGASVLNSPQCHPEWRKRDLDFEDAQNHPSPRP
jgi:hypothetical protein